MNVHDIMAEAVSRQDYGTLTVDELSALCQLQVTLYKLLVFGLLPDQCGGSGHGAMTHGRSVRPALAAALANMRGEMHRRLRSRLGLQMRSALLPQLLQLRDTGLFPLQEVMADLDAFARPFVSQVVSHPSPHYRLTYAAMQLLTQLPLTRIEFDTSAAGHRRYRFSVGGGFYNDTLSRWAATQQPDGAWPGVPQAEALTRVIIFEYDFGSVPGIDNASVASRAYNHYSRQCCRTAEALELLRTSCCCRWHYSPTPSDLLPFQAEVHKRLSRSLSLSDRLRLHNVAAAVRC